MMGTSRRSSTHSGDAVEVNPVIPKGSSSAWIARQNKALERWEQWRENDRSFKNPVPWDGMSEEDLREYYQSSAGIESPITVSSEAVSLRWRNERIQEG